MFSIVEQKAVHPAYQRIIGMGKQALPFIFRELQQKGGHWIWALRAITREDPTTPEDNSQQTIAAWLEWGRKEGYLA